MHIDLKTPIPGPKSQALMHEREKNVARGPFHTTPVFISRAKGAIIEDVDGNQLLDFASGIGVVNVGHSPESVVEAVYAQSKKFLHAGFNVTPYEGYVRLCKKLNELAPGNFSKKTFLANSGAEAVENSIKIARSATGRSAVICFDHAFHGRTYMAMALTSKAKPYKSGFAPFAPEVYRAPFPYTFRWKGDSEETVYQSCFSAFEDLASVRLNPKEVAAVIIEPILGEGGFVPAPRPFLKLLRDFCTQHGIILIADEIQTGFGRTGTLFASEQLAFEPDLILSAKGLGGGLPISSVTGRTEIMDAPALGGIGGTFGGNPLACASALSVIELLLEPSFLKHARELGEHLKRRLEKLRNSHPLIGDVRGIGPMQAMELVLDRNSKEPASEKTKSILQSCLRRGLIIMNAGSYGNVIRFLIPLVMSLSELNEGCDVIEKALSENR